MRELAPTRILRSLLRESSHSVSKWMLTSLLDIWGGGGDGVRWGLLGGAREVGMSVTSDTVEYDDVC